MTADLREELANTRKAHEDELKQLRLDLNRVTGRKTDSQVQGRSRSVVTVRDDSAPSVFSAKKIYSVDPVTIERTPRKTGNAMNKPISVGTFNPPKRPQLLAPINLADIRSKQTQLEIRRVSASRHMSMNDVFKPTHTVDTTISMLNGWRGGE